MLSVSCRGCNSSTNLFLSCLLWLLCAVVHFLTTQNVEEPLQTFIGRTVAVIAPSSPGKAEIVASKSAAAADTKIQRFASMMEAVTAVRLLFLGQNKAAKQHNSSRGGKYKKLCCAARFHDEPILDEEGKSILDKDQRTLITEHPTQGGCVGRNCGAHAITASNTRWVRGAQLWGALNNSEFRDETPLVKFEKPRTPLVKFVGTPHVKYSGWSPHVKFGGTPHVNGPPMWNETQQGPPTWAETQKGPPMWSFP